MTRVLRRASSPRPNQTVGALLLASEIVFLENSTSYKVTRVPVLPYEISLPSSFSHQAKILFCRFFVVESTEKNLMGLRLKTAATVTTIFSALLGAIYLLFSEVILGEFAKIETNQATVDLSRVIEAVKNVERDLEARAIEWSHWDDVLDYIRTPHHGFIQTNFEGSPFDFQDLLFLNMKGDVVFAGRIDKDSDHFNPLPEADKELLFREVPLRELLKSKELRSVSGFIRSGDIPLIVAASALSDTSATKPPQGVLVFTRRLSTQLQEKISALNHTTVAFDLLPSPSEDTVGTQDVSSQPSHIKTYTTQIDAIGVIPDLHGRPVLRIAFSIPRQVYTQGRAALN
ncbi:MAG: hypothetical protein RL326_910, partial [Pseudomonadota bacterium]